MSRHESDASSTLSRQPAGMGLATRFTLWIGLWAVIVAAAATWILLGGVIALGRASAEEARLNLAKTTGRLWAEGAVLPPSLPAREVTTPFGVRVQYATETVRTGKGERRVRIYRVVPPGEEEAPVRWNLFAPADTAEPSEQRLLVLVLLVTGGMLLTVIAVAAVIGRRVAAPVREMIDDVGVISRGRYDHHIHVRGGAGEVSHLGRAVNRMVRDLLEGQENRRRLDKSQREAEVLRELRRKLQPMQVEAPAGFAVHSKVVEARGAGTGDFVDTLTDAQERISFVVGATATRGAPGALLMAMTRAYLRSAILRGSSPQEACEITNTSLNRDLATGLFASAMVGRLDPAASSIELVSAGHKAPAVKFEAATGKMLKLQPNGIALGFDRGPIFMKSLETLESRLEPGDALFLFSPAAFEVQNASGKALGEKGVYALAKIGMERGLDAMEKKLVGFLGGRPEADLAFFLLQHHGA